MWPSVKSTLIAPWRGLPQTVAHFKPAHRKALQERHASTVPSAMENLVGYLFLIQLGYHIDSSADIPCRRTTRMPCLCAHDIFTVSTPNW